MKKIFHLAPVSLCGLFFFVFIFNVIDLSTVHAQTYDGSVIGYMYPSDGASPTAITNSPGLQLMNQRAVYAWITSIKLNTSAAVNVVDCTMGDNSYVYKTFTGPGTFYMNYPDQRNDSCLAIQLVLPTSVSATITLAVTTVNTSSIKLSWNDPFTDTTKYYVCSDTNPFWGPCDTSPGSGLIATIVSNATKSHANTATTYTNTGLNPDTQYYYAVEAANHPDIQSDTVSATTNPNPAPVLTSVTPNSTQQGQSVSVSGSNFSATGNTIKITNSSSACISNCTFTVSNISGTTGANGTASFNLPNPIPNGTYNLTVTNSQNASPSNALSLTVNNPNAPTNLIANWDFNQGLHAGITLTWTNNASQATGYDILRSFDGGSTYLTIKVNNQGTTYFDDLDSTELSGTSVMYKVTADLPNANPSEYNRTGYSVPSVVSNCVKMTGSGPDNIVFMQGKTLSRESIAGGGIMNQFVQAGNVILGGFKEYDPYKSYFNQFSFYVDVQTIDDTNAPTYPYPIRFNGLKFFTPAFGETVKSASSCSSIAGIKNNPNQYFFYFGNPAIYSAFAPFRNVAFINLTTSNHSESVTNTLPVVAIHEMEHSFAGLVDEYSNDIYGMAGWTNFLSPKALSLNCVLSPSQAYRNSFDGLVYGATNVVGCSGYLAPTSPKASTNPVYWYRPSVDGIMWNSNDPTGKFNVIDCGYIVAAIKGEYTADLSQMQYKRVAQKYWPQCMDMDTADRTIIPAAKPNPKETVTSVSNNILTPGDPTITGTGFTPTGNSVQFTNVANSAEYYDINDIPSSDGRTLTFTMPTDTPIPTGTYQLRTGAFNSPWSNPITVAVLGSKLISLSQTPTTPNAPVTVTGINLPIQPTSQPVVMAFFQNGRQVTTVPVTLISSSTLRFNPPQNVVTGNLTVALAYNLSTQLNGPTTQISNSLPFTVAGNSAPTASSCPAGYTCTYTATSTKISNVVPALVSGKLPTSAVLAPPAVTASNVAAPSPSTLASINPTHALPGVTLTVSGYNYPNSASHSLFIYDSSGMFVGKVSNTAQGSGGIAFTVPSVSAGNYSVADIVSGQSAQSNRLPFAVDAPANLTPTITQGPLETNTTLMTQSNVAIYGSNFTPTGNDVKVNGVDVGANGANVGSLPSSQSGQMITFSLPSLPAGTYPIIVSNANGISKSVNLVVDPAPALAITQINPSSGPLGTTVTITGSGFTTGTGSNGNDVYITSLDGNYSIIVRGVQSTNGTTLTLTLPTTYSETPGVYTVNIQNTNGQTNYQSSNSSTDFTLTAPTTSDADTGSNNAAGWYAVSYPAFNGAGMTASVWNMFLDLFKNW